MKFEDKFDEILDDEKLINVIEKYSLYNRELYDIITEPLYDREENQNDYIKNFNKWILPDLKKGGNSMYGKSELQIKAKQFINNFSNHKRNYKKVISRYKNPDEPGIHIFSEHYNDSGFKLCLDIGEDTYEFAKRFEIKCMEKNINFSYRVMDPYEHDEIYRTDKLTVYCDEMNYSLYLRILEQIREENELLDYREPPILTENIDNWVGIAQNGSRESYESKMAKSMDIAFADVYDGVYRDRIFEYAKIYRATLDEVRKDVKGLFPVIEEYFKHEEDEIRDNDEEYKTEEDEKYVFEEFLEEREEKNEEDIEENEQEEYEEEIEENEQEEYEEEIEENEQEEYEEEIEENEQEEYEEEIEENEQEEYEEEIEENEQEEYEEEIEENEQEEYEEEIEENEQEEYEEDMEENEQEEYEEDMEENEQEEYEEDIEENITEKRKEYDSPEIQISLEETSFENKIEDEEETVVENKIENEEETETKEENSSYETNLERLKENIRDIAMNGYSKENTEEYRKLISELYDQRAEKLDIEESRRDRSVNLRRLDSIASNLIIAYQKLLKDSKTTGIINDRDMDEFKYSLEKLDGYFTTENDKIETNSLREEIRKKKDDYGFERDDFGSVGAHYNINEDR